MDTKTLLKTLRLLITGGAFALAAVSATPSYAVNVSTIGLFQLDGNAADPDVPLPTPPILGDDWNDVYPISNLHNGGISTFLVDPPPGETTKVFTSGSKDIGDINTWHWSSGPSPNKADIQHAYAAAYQYTNPNPAAGENPNHLVVYFGADRAATSGTVATGFWFFKNPIKTNADGTFSGHHAEGDTLVAVNYSNGGAVGTIAVYIWTGGQLVPQLNLTNNTGVTGLFCTSGYDVCAITNGSGITTNWTGNNPLKPGQFFEGGIDLSSLVPGSTCFASFMAMSRSSTTTSAELKNFVFGNFKVCDYKVTKFCDTVVKDGNNYIYMVHGTISNTGFGPVSFDPTTLNPYNFSTAMITDAPTPLASPAPAFSITDCNGTSLTSSFMLGSNQMACYSGTVDESSQTSTDVVTVNGAFPDVNNTSNSTSRDSAAATCPQVQSGNLQITNSCTISVDSQAQLHVTVTTTVTNTGSAAVSNLNVYDDQVGGGSLPLTFVSSSTGSGATSLAANGGYATFTGSFVDNNATSLTSGCSSSTDGQGAHATGTDPSGTISSSYVQATCAICPSGVCTTTP